MSTSLRPKLLPENVASPPPHLSFHTPHMLPAVVSPPVTCYHAEDGQDQFTSGRRGIQLLFKGAQRDPTLMQRLDYVEQFPERSPQAVQPVWSKNSCGFTSVVFQEPPESFTTLHWHCTLRVL